MTKNVFVYASFNVCKRTHDTEVISSGRQPFIENKNKMWVCSHGQSMYRRRFNQRI